MECSFCPPLIDSEIIIADDHCYALWTSGTSDGSALVLPRAHRPTLFDLTNAEWMATRSVLERVRTIVQSIHSPDGFNIGWNVMPVAGQSVSHAHCHLVPRYRDEPYSGRGMRACIKEPQLL